MRIVVADDMPSLRMLARMTLVGHEILEAVDGAAALALIRSVRPDLVLIDVNMPGMSGLQVCQEVRRDPAFAGTYIIVISANSQENVHRALGAGANAFLSKPFSPRDLVALVEQRPQRTAAAKNA